MRSFTHADFEVGALVAAKGGRRVSVCLPARDEEPTVGTIVACIRTLDTLVDEVLVVDDGSADRTAAVARAAGARVVRGEGLGKGEAMQLAVRQAVGDIVAFCDADVRNFDTGFVLGLVGPLLATDDVAFVKGYYRRPFEGRPGEGGRVTELMARPLLRVLFPHLAGVVQPLGGECAGRREVFEQVPFVKGWGVDIALVLDVVARYGTGALAQVDLGERVHHNRPLHELSPQAEAVLRTVLARAGLQPAVPQLPPLADEPEGSRKTA
jgi:glucosyl-3-phosphoglycerate synthase